MKKEVQLITESPVLTVNNLNNSDQIGFIHDDGEKGYISRIDANRYVVLSAVGGEGVMVDTYVNSICDSVKEALNIPACIANVYRFDTRKELYQWLAED